MFRLKMEYNNLFMFYIYLINYYEIFFIIFIEKLKKNFYLDVVFIFILYYV